MLNMGLHLNIYPLELRSVEFLAIIITCLVGRWHMTSDHVVE